MDRFFLDWKTQFPHVFGIWFFSWVGLFGHPSGAEVSVPLVLLCEGMALAVSALVDPALSQSFTAFKEQRGVFL